MSISNAEFHILWMKVHKIVEEHGDGLQHRLTDELVDFIIETYGPPF